MQVSVHNFPLRAANKHNFAIEVPTLRQTYLRAYCCGPASSSSGALSGANEKRQSVQCMAKHNSAASITCGRVACICRHLPFHARASSVCSIVRACRKLVSSTQPQLTIASYDSHNHQNRLTVSTVFMVVEYEDRVQIIMCGGLCHEEKSRQVFMCCLRSVSTSQPRLHGNCALKSVNYHVFPSTWIITPSVCKV